MFRKTDACKSLFEHAEAEPNHNKVRTSQFVLGFSCSEYNIW